MPTLAAEILADSPAGYWKLDETSGTTAANSAVKAKNRVPNPRAATNISYWSMAKSDGTYDTSLFRQTADGTKATCGEMVYTAGAVGYVYMTCDTSSSEVPINGFAVTPGETIYLRGSSRVVSGAVTLSTLQFIYEDASGNYLTQGGVATVSTPGNGWINHAASVVVPALAATIRLAIVWQVPTGQQRTLRATEFFCDRIDPGSYFDGSTPGCSWDGTANASASTRDLNGTYTNGPTLNQPGFTQGGDAAVDFDGSNDYMRASGAAVILNDIFTLEAWINIDALPVAGSASSIFCRGSAANRYQLRVTDLGKLILIYDGFTIVFESAAGAIEVGRWYHVAVTKTGATRAMYINGVASTVAGTNATFVDGGLDIDIGARAATPDQRFDGRIQHAAIYPTALSAARILAHYEAGRNALATGAIAGTSTVTAESHADMPTGTATVAGTSSVTCGISPNIPIGPVVIQGGAVVTAVARNDAKAGVSVGEYAPYTIEVSERLPYTMEVSDA